MVIAGQGAGWTVVPAQGAPIGPDDDPEFLRMLAETIRNR